MPSAIASPVSAPDRRAKRTYTVVELFAGAGGLALGLSRAGFKCWDMLEWSDACCETLRANSHILRWDCAEEIKAKDVQEIDFREYRGADVVAAGAPCQPFSQGGDLRGRYDERNMFPQVIRALAEIQPRAFLIENVRGLLFARAESYFKSVQARLRNPSSEAPDHELTDVYHRTAPAAGPDDEYVVSYTLLNAADFGLAQNSRGCSLWGCVVTRPRGRGQAVGTVGVR